MGMFSTPTRRTIHGLESFNKKLLKLQKRMGITFIVNTPLILFILFSERAQAI